VNPVPPGPRLPRAAQALAWTQRPLPFLERCRARYGDAFTLRILHWGDWVVLADPADVKAVFTAGAAVGVDLANPLLGPLLGPGSVMLLEEPEHLRRRRLLLPCFHGESVRASAAAISAIAAAEIGRWPAGEPFALWPRMQDLTLEVVMRSVFGAEPGPGLDPLRRALRELTAWINDPRNLARLAAFGPRRAVRGRGYRRAMGAVEAALAEQLRRRRAAPRGAEGGAIELLLAARREDGSGLGDRDLRDELVTLLSDGPTSTSLAWAFERLLRNPAKLARAERDARRGDGAYLDAVVRETLRLRPPVPVVVRRLLEPMRLAGRELPAGTTVAPCIHLLHRDPRGYERPLAFQPERFLGRVPDTYAWIPFGGGARRCLAASFAEAEMRGVLATVLGSVELRAAGDRAERARKSAISFSPDRSGLVVSEPRRGAAGPFPDFAAVS
jgi:cytochrome P450